MIVIGTIVGAFVTLGLMLSGIDLIARARGFDGAHPLSPAVAWTLLLWSVLFCAALVYSIHIDEQAGNLPTPILKGEGE